MSLRHAILVVLLDGERSGYDMTKIFDASIANSWAASPQQLYRELDKMAGDGLVAGRVIEQQRRPNKQLFSVTDKGRTELNSFVHRARKPAVIRDELLVQITAMQPDNEATVRTALEARYALAQQKLRRYKDGKECLLAGQTESQYLARAQRVGPYLALTRGIAFEQVDIRWCRHAMAILRRRATATR